MSLEVKICVDAAHPELIPIVDAAIEMWEGLEPGTNNCRDCITHGLAPPAAGNPFAFTTMVHELGHCAFGLDHIDRVALDSTGTTYEESNFTRSAAAARTTSALDDGPDNIQGSGDDTHQGLLAQYAESVAWFRSDDNDPFIVDPSTTIDILKYTTARNRLPGNDDWAASANLCVKDPSFCGPNPPSRVSAAQAVMYSAAGRRTLFAALGADDVRGGPRISDRLLRWDSEQVGGVWNAPKETAVST